MVKIGEGIYWVGFVDWNLRNFHGYSTPFGSTYNAYLILDEKVTLIDTVKHYGFEEMLSRIKDVIEPSKIDYIISNHAEMDHSGAIPRLLKLAPQVKVVVSPQGRKNLELQFHEDLNFMVVEDSQTLNIGKRNLQFFLSPMVHWPDSMVTYLKEDKILFSNDAFGQHYASWERFADEVGVDIAAKEAANYYANIVLPFGEQVKKLFGKLGSLDISIIAPSHGLIWRRREDIQKIITLYQDWADYRTQKRAVIIYDTMWNSTEKIALSVKDALEKKGIPVEVYSLKINHISEVVGPVMLSKLIILGSPVINNQIMPTVGSFLTYIKGLRPKDRFGLTLGSYGWSKMAFGELEEGLKKSGIELLEQGIYFQFVPKKEELDKEIERVMPKITKLLKEG
jgi:flavorubredoxin